MTGGRPTSEKRLMAIFMGDKTYEGSVHARCGTTERYVKGGACVHCARVISTEQREALKFQRQEADITKLTTPPQDLIDTILELDDPGDDLQDGAERSAFQQSVDDLM